MELIVKKFDELTTRELYEILKSRAEIFVVEQTCAYLDIDGDDYKSTHVFYLNDDGKVEAYLRLFVKDTEKGVVKMGRVLTLEHGKGLGGKLLHAGVEIAKNRLHAKKIYSRREPNSSRFQRLFWALFAHFSLTIRNVIAIQ